MLLYEAEQVGEESVRRGEERQADRQQLPAGGDPSDDGDAGDDDGDDGGDDGDDDDDGDDNGGEGRGRLTMVSCSGVVTSIRF